MIGAPAIDRIVVAALAVTDEAKVRVQSGSPRVPKFSAGTVVKVLPRAYRESYEFEQTPAGAGFVYDTPIETEDLRDRKLALSDDGPSAFAGKSRHQRTRNYKYSSKARQPRRLTVTVNNPCTASDVRRYPQRLLCP